MISTFADKVDTTVVDTGRSPPFLLLFFITSSCSSDIEGGATLSALETANTLNRVVVSW